MSDFIDSLGPAFLGLQLYRLLGLIDSEGDAALQWGDLEIPSRVSSTLITLSRRGPSSLSEISRALGMAHQLVAQRVKILSDLGLIKETKDPRDGRRTILSLTAKGKRTVEKFNLFTQQVSDVFDEIFDEIDVDAFNAIIEFRKALERQPLSSRLADATERRNKKRRVRYNQRN